MNIDNNYYINKIFDSLDQKHQIEISLIDNIAWFNINKIEYQSCKTFMYLLKDVIEFLSIKNISYIKQHILYGDLELFKSSTNIQINDNEYIISTPIANFPNEIIDVLGIQKN